MKERPILFSAPMVRAILDDRKTQTRRVAKIPAHATIEERDDGTPWPWMFNDGIGNEDYWFPCPFGQPGDRLWVREAIRLVPDQYPDDGTGAVLSEYAADGSLTTADAWPWKRTFLPAMHCPRGLSRITLEVMGVRVERLTDISQVDALSEGISSIRTKEWELRHFRQWRTLFDAACEAGKKPPLGPTPTRSFQALWESINGPGSWDANPWVWVIEFKVVKP